RRHVPRVVTADDLYLALLTEEGRAAAFWHHGAHFTHQLHAGAVGLEVNQARVALDGDLGPRVGRGVVLSNREILPRPDELHRLDLIRAKKSRRLLERRLLRTGRTHQCHDPGQSQSNVTAHHFAPE